MAGQLSPDQAVYRDAIVAATGLDPRVVTAWIACESGWGITKPGHNYLNVGPGRVYGDVASAARDVAATLRSGLYDPVLAARTPAEQLAAIKASPWDAGHYATGCLDAVYQELAGLTGIATTAGVLDIPGRVLGTLGSWISEAFDLDELVGQVLVVVLSGVFVAAAFGIILLGLNRLTADSPTRARIEQGLDAAEKIALAVR